MHQAVIGNIFDETLLLDGEDSEFSQQLDDG